MSIVTIPAGMYFGTFAISQRRYDLREQSDTTGDTRERLMAPPRWRVRFGPATVGIPYDQTALWKSLLMKLQGAVNHLAVYNVAQPAPRGTMRGSMTLNATATAGATSVSIVASGQAATTLLAGDALQVGSGLGSHYCLVTEDATANGSGVITINIQPPLRKQYTSGTAVTWDKPVFYGKMITDSPEWEYQPGAFLVTGFNLEFLEQWS